MFHSPCGLVGWFTKIKQISFYYFILFIPPPFFHSKKALTGMGMATQRCSAGGGGTFGVWQRPKSKVPCAPSAQSQPDAGPLRTFVFYWTKISFFQHPRFLKKDFVVLFFHRKISLSRSNRIQSLTKDQHTPNRWLTNGFSFFFLCVWQRKRPPRPPNILFSVSTTSRVPSAAIACVCVSMCGCVCNLIRSVFF